MRCPFFFLETAQAEGVTTTEAGVGAESYKEVSKVSVPKNDERTEVIRRLATPDSFTTIEGLCAEVGICKQTFYNWIKDEEFCNEVKELIDRYTDAAVGDVWKALIDLAKNGNLEAIKFFFEMKGKYTTGGKSDNDVNINIKVV